MSAEEDLFAMLSTFPGLQAEVGENVFPDVIPEDNALPAVVYARIDTNTINTIGGARVAEDVRFRIEAWAETRTRAEAVADQMALALQAGGETVDNRSVAVDPKEGVYGTALETVLFRNF